MTPQLFPLHNTTSPQPAPTSITSPLVKKSDPYLALLVKCAFLSLTVWVIELIIHYYFLTGKNMVVSLVRSLGITGSTLFAAALFSSAIFKWRPRLAIHWRIRRYLGVAGFVFIFFHVGTAMQFLFNYNLALVYYSLNPIENPVIFGSLAYPIFFIMTATSTDWAVRKLTPKVWKFIHRFVYVAYISSIFHFALMNPEALYNPLGYLLIALTACALFGQLFWFFKISSQKKFRSLGFYIGIAIILSTLLLLYLVLKS